MLAHDIPPELARRLLDLSPDRRADLERKLEEKLRAQDHLPPLTKRADTISLPLSFAQERLFFLWELEP